MDLIDLARQLGKEIQSDEMYIKLRIAEQKLETDTQFQQLISLFNKEKSELNKEMMEKVPDKEKIKKLNVSVQEKYEEINKNPNMVFYQQVQKDFSDIVNKINNIILRSAQGEDPYIDDYYDCGGTCSSCSGCH